MVFTWCVFNRSRTVVQGSVYPRVQQGLLDGRQQMVGQHGAGRYALHAAPFVMENRPLRLEHFSRLKPRCRKSGPSGFARREPSAWPSGPQDHTRPPLRKLCAGAGGVATSSAASTTSNTDYEHRRPAMPEQQELGGRPLDGALACGARICPPPMDICACGIPGTYIWACGGCTYACGIPPPDGM